ncbi:MAG TPA: thioredoxin domain-containing protein [bacterium]|nr:thioredoxin domain-containing protein [bacterium]
MKLRWLIVLFVSIAIGILAQKDELTEIPQEKVMTHKYTNRLAQEKSPYLLQHAHNPVDWYAWGPEAFEKAKTEDKPIFLSIGYSTCHWCHVMERESFENEDIARVLNENFVSIKVDREERPDVDQIYMNAVQGMTGSGGWPLSAFLTHELEPFWGGTYFPPESRWGRPGFKDILLEISKFWKTDRQKLTEAGKEVGAALQSRSRTSAGMKTLSEETLRRAFAAFRDLYDPQYGGFGGAPKFPRSETISLLFRIYRRTGEKQALAMGMHTLDRMARGGMYDHLGGGFSRYSTDERWLVPHFEKMLYDNALLARAYLEAFQIDGNPMWEGVARETLDYVLRDMTAPEGGFYSAEDADSEGEEGKFYVWTEGELKPLLSGEQFQAVKEHFQVTPQGNFEGHTILSFKEGTPWASRYSEPLKSAIKTLFDVREKRIHPYKDDKVIASWNGLMIGSLAFAAQILDDERYLKAARKAAAFVTSRMWDGKTLKRRYRDGDVRFDGSLDDYTFLASGLLDLYETDFDPKWFSAAMALQKRADELFWDDKDGGYFFTAAGDPTLIARSKEIYDGAVPSGNSIAALNLLKLYDYTLDDAFSKKAEFVQKAFSEFVSSHPQASPALLMAVDYATDDSKEIVVAGRSSDGKRKALIASIHHLFLPNKVLAANDPAQPASGVPLAEGKTEVNGEAAVYLCQGHACRKPVTKLDDVLPDLKASKTYKIY